MSGDLGDLPARIVEAIDDSAIFALDIEGRVIWWNRGAEELTGWTAAEMIGRDTSQFYEPAALEAGIPNRMMATLAAVGYYHVEDWRLDGAGRRFWASVTLNAMRDRSGRVVGYSGVTRDLTDQYLAERALRESEGRLRSITEAVNDAIVSVDASHRIVSFNAAASRLYGIPVSEAIGESIEILIPPGLREQAVDYIMGSGRRDRRSRQVEAGRRFETHALHRSGREVPVELTLGEWTQTGERHVVGVVRDITERTQAQADLRYLADHDPLTGLLNRRRFEAELSRVVTEMRTSHRCAALLVLDLDGFKEINDRYGHSVGDELIVKIGTLLAGSVRQSDAVGRLGGDEFGILLADADLDRARALAGELTVMIRTVGLTLGTSHVSPMTVSTGITELCSGDVRAAADLLIEADSAMYAAKAHGRNQYQVHERDAATPVRNFERRSWLGRLRRALDENLFELYSQPIVAVADRHVARRELLLRLCDEPEPLCPGAFLDDAERFGLIGDIDRWVLGRAVELLHEAHAAGRELAVAVNLSGRSMNDATIVSHLRDLLIEHPIPPHSLLVEVTETAAIVNLHRAADLARELRELGCEFALDDFGSGFSSLLYLKHLEFDYLKIDGEFIERLISTPTDQLVVRAVVQIARGLGTRTIAECVPDDRTMALLAELGVDYGQGYHLGRPEPLPE